MAHPARFERAAPCFEVAPVSYQILYFNNLRHWLRYKFNL